MGYPRKAAIGAQKFDWDDKSYVQGYFRSIWLFDQIRPKGNLAVKIRNREDP